MPLPLALFACGDPLIASPPDGWLSGASTTESTEPPSDPHMAVRWYAGPERGTVVPCDSRPIEASSYAVIYGNVVGATVPDDLAPPVWAEGPGYRYALAMFVLNDGPLDGRATVDDPYAGVWGIADLRVRFFVEGDLQLVEDLFELEGSDPDQSLRSGAQWLIVRPEPPLTDGWDGVLLFEDTVDDVFFSDDTVSFFPLSYAYFHTLRLFGGLGPGGITFEACP